MRNYNYNFAILSKIMENWKAFDKVLISLLMVLLNYQQINKNFVDEYTA